MKRLIEYTVSVGLDTAWRLARRPTRRSPALFQATTEGVVRLPSLFWMTFGSPPSMTDTTLLVVPRSMPMILAMSLTPLPRVHLFSQGLNNKARAAPAIAAQNIYYTVQQ
jgi:hypothetical protein